MKLAHRNWRTIACHRGVPSVKNRREFDQCLLEQMTPAERDKFGRQNLLVLAVTAAAYAFCYWYGYPVFGVLVASGVYASLYQCVDPFYRAQQEYLAVLESELHVQNERVREERTSRGH
jgi:hypothetical protein